jgi:chromosome segregation ATPase
MSHSYFTTLADTLRHEREQRSEALRQLREQARTRLDEHRDAFANATSQKRNALRAYRTRLEARVSEQCTDMAHARERMAQIQDLRLSGFRSDLQAEVATMLADYSNARITMANTLRMQLATDVAAIRSEVQQTLAAASEARSIPRPAGVVAQSPGVLIAPTPVVAPSGPQINHAGTQAYAQLARVSIIKALEASAGNLSNEIRAQIDASFDGLQANVNALRADIEQRRTSMSDTQRSQTNAHIDALHKTCQALSDDLTTVVAHTNDAYVRGLQAGIGTILDNIAITRQLLNEQRPTRRRTDDIRDDLTTIRGIGKNIEQRLNQAGIFTFIQIALSTPAELRKALGGARVANLEDWIDQARKLAGMPG